MTNTVFKKYDKGIVVLIVGILFLFLSPLKFTDKCIFSSEIILLYLFFKNLLKEGFVCSLKNAFSSWKRTLFILSIFLITLLAIALAIEKCSAYSLMCLHYIKITIVVFTGILLAFMYSVVWKREIYQIFLVLCFSVGMSMMMLLPVGIPPDEGMHSFTSYRISNFFLGIENNENEITMRKTDGEKWIVSEIGYYSNEKYQEYLNTVNDEVVDNTLNSYSMPYTVGTDFLYILPALGIAIGRLLTWNSYQMYYLGRIFNFILYLLGMTYVIKKAPFKKSLFLALGVLPVFLQQAISNSYDVPINLMIFIIIVNTIRLFKKQPDKLSRLDWILLVISCVAMCVVKSHAYILVGIMPLLCFGMKKICESKYHKRILIGMGCAFILGVIAVFAYSKTLPEVILNNKDSYTVLYLLQNPKEIFAIAFNTFQTFDTYFIDTFIGKYLGYLDVVISSSVIYVYYIILVFLFVPRNEEKNQITGGFKFIFLFVSLITAAFAFFGMLLANSTLQDRMILGMQGRYLLASIALLYFVIEPHFVLNVEKRDDAMFCLLFIAEFCTIANLMLVI